MASGQSTTMSKIKRKPPPSFPYSPRWPEPDPKDPFAPLSVLRSRAHSSTTALDTPPDDQHSILRPSTADSRKTHVLFADAQSTEHPYNNPQKTTDSEPQRPWHGLANGVKGYFTEATKPLRPPRSKKRMSQGGDFMPSFSDADFLSDTTRQRLTVHQDTQPHRDVEATPRDKRASIHRRDSQYHYRRRSQSVNALIPSRRTSVAQGKEPARANTSESAQFAYDVRQSHGYVFGETDRLDFIDSGGRPRRARNDRVSVPAAASTSRSLGHSRSSTRSETSASEVSRHPTPPMTPDDTLSSISMTSPRRSRSRSLSPQLLLEELPDQMETKPLPVPSDEDDDDDMITHSNRNTIIVDTPVTGVRSIQSADFSILLPHPALAVRAPSRQSSIPPSPTVEEPLAPLAASVARLPGRRVESDTEVTVVNSLRRRSRTTSLNEMRKRLRSRPSPSANPTSIRGKIISNPSPALSNPSSFAVPPVPAAKRLEQPAPVRTLNLLTRSPSLGDTPVDSKSPEMQSQLVVPKPKKSLSHVNLGLKPLPNMSLAPTIAPSANTSIASVSGYGALSLTRPRDGEPVRAQSVPAHEPSEPRPQSQRAQTDISKHVALSRMSVVPALPPHIDFDSDQEDLATYSILTHFARELGPVMPLLPSPVIDVHPPRVSSPIPIPKSSKGIMRNADPAPQRRGSDKSNTARSTSPAHSEPAVPRAALAASARSEVPACYRMPEPLPLSPPPRAKSPIAAHFQTQQPQESLDSHMPPRALSPVPVRAKAAQEVRNVQTLREDDERSSQRSSQQSRSHDETGYFPVAQLRPVISRQGTTQSRASNARPPAARGLSGCSTKAQVGAREESPAPEPQPKSRAPSRARSPEPQPSATRTAAAGRAKRPPPAISKDLDSPLPPPPMEFLAQLRASPEELSTLPLSPSPTRDFPELSLSEPMPLTSPAGQSSPPLHPFRQQRIAAPPPASTPSLALARTATTTTMTVQSQPEDFMHGRSCSPAQSHAFHAYPPTDFDIDAVPAREQIARAAAMVVVSQNGVRVPFGDVFNERKTIVVFIRHFWCPLCQDYMHSISKSVDPEALERANVGLVVIGNGSPAMIKSYRQIFRMPFALYSDPTHKLYNALGMTLRTTDPGLEHERGAYVRHGLVSGIAMVVRNALKVGMPVWEKGGDHAQLGGEFVLGPGMTCSYAHRMKNTRAHAPIADVVAAAGVQGYTPRSAAYRRESSETWRPQRQSEERAGSKREKRSIDCDVPEFCNIERPYDGSKKRSASAATTTRGSHNNKRHVRDVTASDADTEEDGGRNRIGRPQSKAANTARARGTNMKRAAAAKKNYRVANPDRVRPPRSDSTEKYEMWRPATATATNAPPPQVPADYENDEAYMFTHEVLAYSFGNKI